MAFMADLNGESWYANQRFWLNKNKIYRVVSHRDHKMASFEMMRLNLVFIEEWQRCLWYRALRIDAVRTVANKVYRSFTWVVVLRRCVSFVFMTHTHACIKLADSALLFENLSFRSTKIQIHLLLHLVYMRVFTVFWTFDSKMLEKIRFEKIVIFRRKISFIKKLTLYLSYNIRYTLE